MSIRSSSRPSVARDFAREEVLSPDEQKNAEARRKEDARFGRKISEEKIDRPE
jgi:hypothetical protein